jgi:cupin fold WbuC family metalloprotein
MNDPQIQLINESLFASLIERARQSPRLRVNHNFHGSLQENPHRFLNVMVRGTCVTPHRHTTPPKPEAFVMLSGEVAFFTFDDSGDIRTVHVLGGRQPGIDVAAGVWHTLAVLSPEAVCYEVKPGPYSPSTDKDFAPWAPREGEPGTAEYLKRLLACVPPSSGLL